MQNHSRGVPASSLRRTQGFSDTKRRWLARGAAHLFSSNLFSYCFGWTGEPCLSNTLMMPAM
jgi:hypothetical protein